ncbi:MAG: DEAD/DEAH box helicase family protein [Armatimonadetes bacterium]|nr:DEAD/DEAH box helicase family protein [Armatimonadota bacterium]
MLKDLSLLPVYDSATCDLIRAVQVPLLQNSVEYLRGVGYFSSGWLRIAAPGMADLVSRGGRARIVIAPILQAEDWEAMKTGEEARIDEGLRLALTRNVLDLRASLESDTLNALAWMVADGVLEFRFAILRDQQGAGDYHDKVGIFTDAAGDSVAIHGSLNDSVRGSLNGEAFSVFASWDAGQRPYVQLHRQRLEALWDDQNVQFRVRRLPEAVREQFVRLRTTPKRPYCLPAAVEPPQGPRCPVALRSYQEDAVQAWEEAGCRGIFEMATGTGKTYAAIAAAVRQYEQRGRLAVLVLVPYLHLLEQWARDIRAFGFSPVLCSGEHLGWSVELQDRVRDLRMLDRGHLCVVAVHQTAASSRFARATSQLPPSNSLLIADEVHALGAPQLRRAMLPGTELRLGLSATPRRWYDDAGTATLTSYFGSVCFEFPLEKAIGKYLTPYSYHPHLVGLSDSEMGEYESLTSQVTALAARAERDAEVREQLRQLLIRRARIIGRAAGKLPRALAVLESLMADDRRHRRETQGLLVYCAPGTHTQVLRAVADRGLRCHEFVHTVSLGERERLLSQFAEGVIQALVAIKCLDEGVDVPSTRTALILASSTNPREFVQRRGRILRKAEGKDRAVVHDFIVIPPERQTRGLSGAELGIFQREMPRFAEFASSALNEFEARAVVRETLDRIGMLHLLDRKPWDVYHTLKQWDWD